ncbi:MAG: YraN family protein [Flavobacteriales bacterium]
MERQGKEGEEAAVRYLKDHGYSIRERNWTFGQREVDIIAEKEDLLIIAEVKTQKNRRFGSPQFRVNKNKQENLVQAANGYVHRKGLDRDVRFDILAVIINQEGEEVHHIEDAFGPRW